MEATGAKPEVRHMITEEVVEAIEAGRVPIVPVATLETHDPHLPVEVDLRFVEEVSLRAARQRPDLFIAFPAVGYGYTEHTMDFPGGFTIRPQVLLDFYFDIGESIAQNGFRKLMYLNGHGSNANVMQLAARLVTMRTPALAVAANFWDLCRDALRDNRDSEFPGGMAHACEFETALYMVLEPERVHHDRIEDCVSTINDEFTHSDTLGSGPVHLVPWWSQTSGNGTEGNPSLATPEKGQAYLKAAVDNLIRWGERFQQLELPPKRDRRSEHLRWDPVRR